MADDRSGSRGGRGHVAEEGPPSAAPQRLQRPPASPVSAACRRGPGRHGAALMLALALLGGGAPVPCAAQGGAGELYCGKENCYSLLGLTRDASAGEVQKAFRKLALQWHPDKNRDPEAPAEFRSIGRANEVLSEEKLRRAYDYFLDHPEESIAHYYQYYNAVYSPQTPIWMVVLGVLFFVSGLQYINQNWKYSSMMRAIKYQPSFKRRVNERVEEEVAELEGKVELEVLRERVEAQVFDSEVHVGGGGFAKPSLKSLALVSAVRSPYDLSIYVCEVFRWHRRFSWNKEEYGTEERKYLTRRVLGMSQGQWEYMEEEQREEMVGRELWLPENLQAFHKEREEEMRERLAQSGAYKRAKRWHRKNG